MSGAARQSPADRRQGREAVLATASELVGVRAVARASCPRQSVAPRPFNMRRNKRESVYGDRTQIEIPGLGIVMGVAIGALAASLSGHMGVWLAAGISVGLAAGRRWAARNVPSAKRGSTATDSRWLIAHSSELRSKATKNEAKNRTKGVHHGTTRASRNLSPGQSQRPHRQGRRARKR